MQTVKEEGDKKYREQRFDELEFNGMNLITRLLLNEPKSPIFMFYTFECGQEECCCQVMIPSSSQKYF